MFARGLATAVVMGLAACGPQYSPDTYSTSAVQQANKVDRGVVVGARRVDVSATGVAGAATGAAAGGIAGSQTAGGVGSAFGSLGGALLGGLVGSSVEHVAGDTTASEYIVRKPSGELISVTQRDLAPLAVGTKVLVIAGNQARIVPDYTVDAEPAAAPPPPPQAAAKPEPPTETAPPPPPVTSTPLAPPTAAALPI